MADDQPRRPDCTSAGAAEAARRHRHRLLGEDLRQYHDAHGPFTEAELADARKRIHGH